MIFVARGCAILLSLTPLYAQQPAPRARIGLSSVPLWPANGDFSSVPYSQAVFFNPAGNEYIVTSADTVTGGRTVLLRAPSHRAVDFSIQVTVVKNPSGTFTYEYTVLNGARARQPIGQWTIETEQSQVIQFQHASWQGSLLPALPTPTVFPEPHQALRFRNHAQFVSPAGGEIQAGQSASGFTITSDLAPGFVEARAKGRSAVPDVTQQQILALPPAAAAQLSNCLSDIWDTQGQLVLGPAVAKDVPAAVVEANFSRGISPLARPGVESATITNLQALIRSAITSDTQVVSATSLAAIAKSASAAEAAIIQAFRSSLDYVGALAP
jgi:hypothetical protein